MYHREYHRRAKQSLSLKWWIFLTFFAIVYPMLISVHNFLPVFFGLAGYIFVISIRTRNKPLIVLLGLYLLNLEINLSMPLFCGIISLLFFYLLIFPKIKGWTNNRSYIPIISVLFIYISYYIVLYIDDLIFSTSNHNIQFTWLLFYSFLIDILVMVFYDYK